jgi:hypothetical protein
LLYIIGFNNAFNGYRILIGVQGYPKSKAKIEGGIASLEQAPIKPAITNEINPTEIGPIVTDRVNQETGESKVI